MGQDASFTSLLSALSPEPIISNDGWDLTPIVAVIAVVVIVGFAVAAAGWVIKRDA